MLFGFLELLIYLEVRMRNRRLSGSPTWVTAGVQTSAPLYATLQAHWQGDIQEAEQPGLESVLLSGVQA